MNRRGLLVSGFVLLSGCSAESQDDAATPTPAPASFTVSITSAPDEVAVGDPASLEAEITNTGEQHGTTEYVLSVANKVIAEGEVSLDGGESTDVEGQFDTAPYDAQEVTYRADVGDETTTGNFTLIADVDYSQYYANIKQQMDDTIPMMEFRYTDYVELTYISSAPYSLDTMRAEMAAFIGAYLRQVDEFGMPPEELVAGAHDRNGNLQIMWKIAEEWVVKYTNGELSAGLITQMANENLVTNPP